MSEAYIVRALRTAGGRRGGALSGWHPVDLAASVVDGLLERSGADPDCVEDLIVGCVSQAGEQSTNVGRNVVLEPATTFDMVGRHDVVKPTLEVVYDAA